MIFFNNKSSGENTQNVSVFHKIGKYIKWYLIISFILGIIGVIYLEIDDARNQRVCSKIEQAIADYDFVTAHEYLTKVRDDKDEMVEKVARAEITYNVINGQLEHALQIALESHAESIYSEIMTTEVNKKLSENRLQEAYNILVSWQFSESFKSSSTDWCNDEEKQNKKYNEQINSFNSLVDNLMSRAIASKDMSMANNCLVLYKPIAVLSEKTQIDNNHCDFKYELQDLALESAQKKLKAAGMKM